MVSCHAVYVITARATASYVNGVSRNEAAMQVLLALALGAGALQPSHRSARPARRTQLNAEDPDKPMTLYDLPAEGEPWLNRYSSMLTRNKKQGASQAMLYATGLTQEDMSKPVWKSKFYGASVLNRRVDLHAIDATPAR